MRYLFAIAALPLAGCQTSLDRVLELPLYQSVVEALPPMRERPYPIVTHEHDWTSEGAPDLYPYALFPVAGTIDAYVAKSMERIGRYLGADVVIADEGGGSYAGSAGTFGAFGPSRSRSSDLEWCIGTCYRVAKCRIGVGYNDSGLVTTLSDEARAAGLLEGDHLVSLNGLAVKTGDYWQRSPHFRLLHDLEPGSEVEAVWIRPGTGRMSGTFVTLPNEGDLSVIPEWEKLGREQLEDSGKYTF